MFEIIKQSGDYVALYFTYFSKRKCSVDIVLNQKLIAFVIWQTYEYGNEKVLYDFVVFIEKKYRNIPAIHNLMAEAFHAIYLKYFQDFRFKYEYLDPRFRKMIERKVKYGKLPAQILERIASHFELSILQAK
jgi:hypothetical protein